MNIDEHGNLNMVICISQSWMCIYVYLCLLCLSMIYIFVFADWLSMKQSSISRSVFPWKQLIYLKSTWYDPIHGIVSIWSSTEYRKKNHPIDLEVLVKITAWWLKTRKKVTLNSTLVKIRVWYDLGLVVDFTLFFKYHKSYDIVSIAI